MLAQLFQVCSFSPFIFDEIIQKAEPTWNKQFEKLHQWWVWWILRFFNYTALSCLSRRESKARPFTLSCNVLYLVSSLLRAEKLDSAKNKERISILGDETFWVTKASVDARWNTPLSESLELCHGTSTPVRSALPVTKTLRNIHPPKLKLSLQWKDRWMRNKEPVSAMNVTLAQVLASFSRQRLWKTSKSSWNQAWLWGNEKILWVSMAIPLVLIIGMKCKMLSKLVQHHVVKAFARW